MSVSSRERSKTFMRPAEYGGRIFPSSIQIWSWRSDTPICSAAAAGRRYAGGNVFKAGAGPRMGGVSKLKTWHSETAAVLLRATALCNSLPAFPATFVIAGMGAGLNFAPPPTSPHEALPRHSPFTGFLSSM